MTWTVPPELRRGSLTLAALILCMVPWRAEAAPGQAGAPFLRILPSARSAALSGSLAAGQGLEASESNPAAMATLKALEANLTHLSWLQGYSLEHAALAAPLGPVVLGGSATLLSSPEIEGSDPQGRESASYKQQDLAAGLEVGMSLGPMDLGGKGRWVRCSLADRSSQGFAGSLGLGLAMPLGLRFGLAGLDFGSLTAAEQEGSAMPASLRAALSWDLERGAPSGLGLEAGVAKPLDSALQALAGAELRWRGMLFGRAGLRFSPDDDGRQFFSFGAGARVYGLGLDYSFTPVGILGNAHRISLSLHTGDWTVQKAAERRALALAAPRGLKAEPGEGLIRLSWSAPPGPAPLGYNLYVRKGHDQALEKVNRQPAKNASATLRQLDTSLEYGVAVAAVALDGQEGERSQELAVRPMTGSSIKLAPPAPPRGLSAKVENGRINLLWEPSPEPALAGYQVLTRAKGSSAWVKLNKAPLAAPTFELKASELQGRFASFSVRALVRGPSGLVEGEMSQSLEVRIRP